MGKTKNPIHFLSMPPSPFKKWNKIWIVFINCKIMINKNSLPHVIHHCLVLYFYQYHGLFTDDTFGFFTCFR